MDIFNFFVDTLNSLGINWLSFLPQIIIFTIGFFIFHKFSVKPISNNINKTQKCLEGINHASREMQDRLKTIISKTENMEDWSPLHSLEEKLEWSSMNSPMFLNSEGNSLLDSSPIGEFLKKTITNLKKL